MELNCPPRREWKYTIKEFEELLINYRKEPEIRQYFTANPWILSLVFGGSEGVIFSEYRIGPREHADHLVVYGRSLYMRVSLIELKKPDDKVLTARGTLTAACSEAIRQTTSRLELIKSDQQHFLRELKENIVRVSDRATESPFQGVIHDNFFGVVRFDDIENCHYDAKIVLGRRADETLDERKHKTAVFNQYGIEIIPYDRFINALYTPPYLEPKWSWK